MKSPQSPSTASYAGRRTTNRHHCKQQHNSDIYIYIYYKIRPTHFWHQFQRAREKKTKRQTLKLKLGHHQDILISFSTILNLTLNTTLHVHQIFTVLQLFFITRPPQDFITQEWVSHRHHFLSLSPIACWRKSCEVGFFFLWAPWCSGKHTHFEIHRACVRMASTTIFQHTVYQLSATWDHWLSVHWTQLSSLLAAVNSASYTLRERQRLF